MWNVYIRLILLHSACKSSWSVKLAVLQVMADRAPGLQWRADGFRSSEAVRHVCGFADQLPVAN
jgi:hypothetical protein